MRNEFKIVTIEDESYLYPVPVVKNKKYLISIPLKFAQFIVNSIQKGFLESPDNGPTWLKATSMHRDGRTPIYSIVHQQLTFKFLPLKDKDLKKAQTIHTLISGKINNVLKGIDNASCELKKRFEAQQACSTCQELGINDPGVVAWIQQLY